MNKAVSFPNCGQTRSTTAAGTKAISQLSEGFRNEFMFVIHQLTGTDYNGEDFTSKPHEEKAETITAEARTTNSNRLPD